MSAVTPCVPQCCPTTQVVNTPGAQGLPGTAGANGANAFSVVSTPFVIPAVSSTVTVSVNSTAWMAIGQIVVAGVGQFGGSGGPASFSINSIPSATSVILTFLGYPGDVAAGTTIGTNSTISPAGVLSKLTTPLSVIGVGGTQQLTTSFVELTLNATAMTLTLASAGTYLVFCTVRFDYVGATFGANQTISARVFRSNNTPAQLTGAISTFETAVITTLSYSAGFITLPPVVYATTNTTDAIEIDAKISATPSAGSVQAIEGSLTAVKLF